MEDQVTSSSPLDLLPNEEYRENSIIRKSSEISKDLRAAGSMSRQWTNERHSSYLDSMEASFVRQLQNQGYHSMDMHGQHTRLDGQPAVQSTPSNQFKVLQSGCWKKINFEPAQHKTNRADDSRVLLENQWIRRFKYNGKQQDVTMSDLQEDGAQSSESVHTADQKLELHGAVDRKKTASTRAAMFSRKLHNENSHQYDKHYVSSDTEVSDQNFVDEDDQQKHTSHNFTGKKMKMESSTVLMNDQVVPLRKFSTIEFVDLQVYARKDGIVRYGHKSENSG